MKNFYKSKLLLVLVGLMVLCMLFLDVYIFLKDIFMFWVTFPALLLISGLTIGKLLQIRRYEFTYYEETNHAIDSANRVALVSFPLPVALVNDNRIIVWTNDAFNKCFYKPDEEENSLDEVTEEMVEMFIGDGREIEFDGRTYRVYARVPQFTPDESENPVKLPVDALDSVNKITMLFFSDRTEFKSLQEEYRLSHPVVIIVMVDNYEELLSESRESEKAYVTIQVDRLLEEYFSEKNAVLRKITGEKFLIILEERYVSEMIDDKMRLLDRAREIKVKDRASVTLSIGVGRTAENLSQSEIYARQALDMALGRGGDQAAVKTESGFKFFGAVSQGSERYSRVKTRIMADDIKELIRTCDAVYIMGHSFGDFDSIGAAVGLACAIRRLGVSACAVVNREQNAAKSLIAKFDEYEVPVVVDPGEARERVTENSLLIIVDTHTIKKLDDKELFAKFDISRVVVIDHHRLSAGAIQNPAVMWQDPNASSASELVTELIQYFGINSVLSPMEAEALLSGITLDTKCFVMRTRASTFEAAAYLRKLGADTVSVKNLFSTSIEDKAKKSEIISSAVLYRSCAVAIVKEPFRDIRVICSQAADDMLYISDVDASFTIYPIGENAWSISARSLGKINVQVIMESIGNKKDDGGGHQSMAGAQLYDISGDEALKKLYEAIDSYYDGLSQN